MITIRKMERGDAELVRDMMRRFYNSPALITNGSEKIYVANVAACLDTSTCLEGFVFVDGGKVIGYGMTARSFSTEFGGECVWIEDIYVEAAYRGQGIGTKFINHVKELYPDKILRLEVEGDNDKAQAFYKRLGFKALPYLELVRTGD